MKALTVSLILLAVVCGFFLIARANSMDNSMERYEQCVLDRSGHTPDELKAITGHYPECN